MWRAFRGVACCVVACRGIVMSWRLCMRCKVSYYYYQCRNTFTKTSAVNRIAQLGIVLFLFRSRDIRLEKRWLAGVSSEKAEIYSAKELAAYRNVSQSLALNMVAL